MSTSIDTHDDITALLAGEAAGSGRRRVRTWLVGFALIAATGLAVRYVRATSPSANAPTYLTATVARGDLHVQVSATGTLQPTNTVDIGSELSGLVVAVFVDENAVVKQGQVLARLDTSRLQDQITRSEATLAAAEARVTQTDATVREATVTVERLREVSRLSNGKVPSKAEMDAAEATLARAAADRLSAVASVTEVRATVNSDRTSLAKASIRSPIDGIVLSRSVEPGQTVAASLQVATLFTIAEDLRKMELEVAVDEADVGRVGDGQTATFSVDAYPGRTYDAHVTRVAFGATTTADVVSYATVLVVANDDLSLRPGMTASAEIATASVTAALLVPNAALRYTPEAAAASGPGFVSSLMPGPPRGNTTRVATTTPADGTRTVWVLRNGAAQAVAVTTGVTDGTTTEVLAGALAEGDQVITEATTGATS